MTQKRSSAAANGYGVLTLGVAGALLAATGVPEPESLAQLQSWGLPEAVARAALYALPVIVILAAVLLGRIVGRGRSSTVRWIIYAAFGGVAGFLTAYCLELFAAVPGMIERVAGPLAEPTVLDIFLWVLAAYCIGIGLMMTGVSLFGRPAMTAMQLEEVDPEVLEVRRAERVVFGWSALGLATLGVACAGLAVARQAGVDERTAPIVIAGVAGVVSVVANYVLWRGFDEMQRRNVVNGYAVSAVVVTLAAFIWAALQAVALAPALDATGVFLALIFIQICATTYVTSKAMGNMHLVGKPA